MIIVSSEHPISPEPTTFPVSPSVQTIGKENLSWFIWDVGGFEPS